MSNPYSKKIELKKEKQESEYLREMKEKTKYKKYENIFDTIQQIKEEKEKINEKEYQQFIKFREKCIEIEWFPISIECIKERFNRLPFKESITWEDYQTTSNIKNDVKNEMFDFLQIIVEDIVHEDFLEKHINSKGLWWDPHNYFGDGKLKEEV